MQTCSCFHISLEDKFSTLPFLAENQHVHPAIPKASARLYAAFQAPKQGDVNSALGFEHPLKPSECQLNPASWHANLLL